MQDIEQQQHDPVPEVFSWAGAERQGERLPRLEEFRIMGNERCGGLISEELNALECDLNASKGLELLDAAGVTSAPVVDDNGVLVGVVFLSALARLRAARAELEVEDAMITDVVTAPDHATVAEVARLMAEHGLERLPIVSNDGHLIGVVSAMDVVRWLAQQLP